MQNTASHGMQQVSKR